jgi:hypothetical protein
MPVGVGVLDRSHTRAVLRATSAMTVPCCISRKLGPTVAATPVAQATAILRGGYRSTR